MPPCFSIILRCSGNVKGVVSFFARFFVSFSRDFFPWGGAEQQGGGTQLCNLHNLCNVHKLIAPPVEFMFDSKKFVLDLLLQAHGV